MRLRETLIFREFEKVSAELHRDPKPVKDKVWHTIGVDLLNWPSNAVSRNYDLEWVTYIQGSPQKKSSVVFKVSHQKII